MSLTVVLSVKQPRSDCSQTVKTYGTKTTELSQWTVIKASLKTLIGFYKITPPFSVCLFLCQCFKFDEMCVCACVSVYRTICLCAFLCVFEITSFQPLCLSFYPHTISLLPPLLVFPQIDNSQFIPHFTLSFPSLNSICVCLWLLYSKLNC